MTGERTEVDVLCIGTATCDLIFSVPQHPGPDEKTKATSFNSCGGGPAANAAVAIARLGYRAAFVGYLGTDVSGERHFQELAREGVLLDLIVRGESPTPLSAILVKPDGQRTVIHYRARTTLLPSHCLDLSSVACKVALFDGHEYLLSPSLAGEAKERGAKTILDAGSVHQGTEALMPIVDYVICSEKFARDFTGETDLEAALVELRAHAPAVVITRGQRGLLWGNSEGSGGMSAFSVEAVDTTGAGDAFHGAFAACVASGAGWEVTLRYASAVAALTCTGMGARPALPTRDDVRDYLETRDLREI